MKQPTSSVATSMETTHGSISSMATAMVASAHQKARAVLQAIRTGGGGMALE